MIRTLLLCTLALTLSAPAAAQTTPPVSGQGQAAGLDGKVGSVLTLFRNTDGLNFTITGAEYTVGPVLAGKRALVAAPDMKFLLLRLTVQNPQKVARYTRGDRVRIVAVDSRNVNHEAINEWFDDQSGQPVELELKPAQKLGVYTYIEVPAVVSVPKLVIDDENDRVVRYDLRGQVKALSDPYRDPSGKDGSVARASFTGKLGQAYAGTSEFRVDRVSLTDKPESDLEVPEGGRLLVLDLTVTSRSLEPYYQRGDYLTARALDADGIEIAASEHVRLQSRNAPFELDLRPGQSVPIRAYIPVEADALEALASLHVAWEDGREAVFDLKGLKK